VDIQRLSGESYLNIDVTGRGIARNFVWGINVGYQVTQEISVILHSVQNHGHCHVGLSDMTFHSGLGCKSIYTTVSIPQKTVCTLEYSLL